MPAPYEVWQTIDFHLGESVKERPAVCLRAHPGGGGLFLPCSTKFDLFENAGNHFEIPDTHPDFAATELDERSYVIREGHALDADQLDHSLGVIQGALREEFDVWLNFQGPAP